MKRTFPSDTQQRFSGNLRHYHRTSSQAQRSWEDWVNGAPTGTPKSKNWLKIIGVTVAILGLLGIIIGLVVELA